MSLIDNGFYEHVLFNSYMNFARIIFSRCKKYFYKDLPLLKQHIAETICAWLESGLKQEIMDKIKDKILAYFESIKPKD